jgi:branched-chain amino acid transport system ATP-binding protein
VSLLVVENLSRAFGGVRAVHELSFTLRPGGIQAIIGPNGAGKTTLFNLITGVLPPVTGHVIFHGREITGLSPHRLAALGIARTFQNLRLFTGMTALENVLLGRHLHVERGLLRSLLRTPALRRSERQAREQARELLAFVGLADQADTAAGGLPYGAMKRLEIARALAVEPKLLLLDEPAAGCNETESAALERLLRAVARNGITVVLVEHDMRLVMSLAGRILVLDHGQKLAEGAPAEIRANPAVVEAYLGHSYLREAEAGAAHG